MISYTMLVFAIMMKGTVQLHVECFLNETLTVQNPNETRFKYFDISSDTDNANCMGEFSDDFLHLFLRNCKLDKQIEVLFRSDNSGILKKENIAGPYRFLCKNIPIGGIIFHVGVGLIVSENSSLPTLIREVDGSLIVTQLGGGFSKQTVNVVSSKAKVEWLFDAPEGFTARPETCTSGSQLFLSRGCSEKHETISNFVQTTVGHKSRYSVTLFTNKFSGSGSTTVVCSMRLCPSQSAKNCELNCDGRRRRRFVAKRRSTGVIYETAILRVEFEDRPSKENVESNSSFRGCDLACLLLSFVYIILKTT